MMDTQAAVCTALKNMGCDLSNFQYSRKLRTFLPDSLALVRFIVEIEQVTGREIPFGSFEISLLDQSITEVAEVLQPIVGVENE